MRIADLILDSPFILAPLAGYTDLPFRLLCREYGAGLVYSEMISCHGLVYGQAKTRAMLKTVTEERPVAMQLFGADPELMAEAAAIVSEQPIDLLDINMGCPVRKVVKRGAGAALMKDLSLAAEIIKKVCAVSRVPVSVKFRSGWDHAAAGQGAAVDFAKMAEDAGANCLAVHGRTAVQAFTGQADHQVIKAVKQAVSIPVIGNGDITSHDQGLTLLKETGCDGVMIGRAALGNPWVFSPAGPPGTMALRLVGMQRYLELINRHYQEPEKILAKIKNLAGRYFKGLPGSSVFRKKIYAANNFQELQNLTTNTPSKENDVTSL